MAKTYEKRNGEIKYSIMTWEDYEQFNPDATIEDYLNKVNYLRENYPERDHIQRVKTLKEDKVFYTYPVKKLNPFTNKWIKTGEVCPA